MVLLCVVCFCFEQKTAYEVRISDWSSDVCSSDLCRAKRLRPRGPRDCPRHRGGFEVYARACRLRRGAGRGPRRAGEDSLERKSGVSGKSVSVRVGYGGRRHHTKKRTEHTMMSTNNITNSRAEYTSKPHSKQ